jgi:putative FmdB family regulatory protein
MPVYDFRCKQCGLEQPFFYKSFAAYDSAVRVCSNCGSSDLTRIIRQVAVQTGTRSYRGMSSQEMLSVLEGGNSREVEGMYRQLGQDPAALGKQAQDIKQAKDAAVPPTPQKPAKKKQP